MEGEHHGMSLRDYFAGQALIGLIARADLDGQPLAHLALARDAYTTADAVLAERGK